MSITIRTRKGSFWRAGVQHTETPVTYEDGTFGASQLDALRCERKLIVEEVAVNGEGKPEANTGKATTAPPALSPATVTPASVPAAAAPTKATRKRAAKKAAK